tara:strand:- start:117 stop:254 length:138 start_codon:yes stop_codon:yes gene_type:complete
MKINVDVNELGFGSPRAPSGPETVETALFAPTASYTGNSSPNITP